MWKEHSARLGIFHYDSSFLKANVFFFLKVGWVRPKRGCLLTLAYYAFPR
jgi:hypothetical protein